MNHKDRSIFESSKIELIIRISLGLILIFAGYQKILNPAAFAKIVAGYQLFPQYTINLIAIFLPFLEFFTGAALLFGIYPRSAALIAAFMLFSFILAVLINMLRGVEFDCGCFSNEILSGKNSSLLLLIRDIFFLFCTLPVILFRNNRRVCFIDSLKTRRFAPGNNRND